MAFPFLLLVSLFFTSLHAQVVNVSTATQLQNALNAAQPGQTIVIADGVYDRSSGIFNIPPGVNGTASSPITLLGSRQAVLTTGIKSTGYGLHVNGVKHWILKGFTTRLCKDGIMIDSSQYITIDSVQTTQTGNSGIHLRSYSSYCTINNCYIDSAGIDIPDYGEGVYIGSAYSNWPTYTQGNPDTCNFNIVTNNRFGSAVAAENIDIKEGTKYGLIRGNIFNGAGLKNQNGGDSWIDAKGNYYLIEDNVGNNTYLDGFQTHIAQPGWGNYNIFRNNVMNVNAPGYGIRVQTSNSNGTATGNIVCNDNTATGAAFGLTNVAVQSCIALWRGNIDSDWNKAGNWSTGRVPNEFDKVIVPLVSTNNLVIKTGQQVNCKSMTVEPGAIVTVQAGAVLHIRH